MSDHDLVIRAGHVVDGTGAPGRTADVAIAGGRIVEVGRVAGRGRRELDADGAVVAPGFVDIHTHYDAQAAWDERLQPSSWHGVTTAVMGNCGVGFAPVVPADHDRLIELMEGVEDIPGAALSEGLPWTWQSFPEYLDAIDTPHDMDFAAQVPHAALRVRAMGERAAARALATEAEIEQMADLAAEAIRAGALGFTTSRTLNHKSVSGELTPSYEAGHDELVAISAAIGRTGQGVLQLVSDWDDPEQDFALMTAMMRASGRPLSFSLAQSMRSPFRYREMLDYLERANADGLQARAQCAARGIGLVLGLDNTLNPFLHNPVYRTLLELPLADRVERMRDPQMRRAITEAGVVTADNLVGASILNLFDRMFELGDPPDYEPPASATIANRAAAQGVSPEELIYDLLMTDGGRGMLYVPFTNYHENRLDAVHEMLTHPHVVPGLSDGGAHVGTICDGSFPTTLLQYWVRDREGDRLSLEHVVARQARATAEAVGLLDRGVLAPGYKADLNIIDLEGLRLHRPQIHHDLPAGGRRMLQRVDGIAATVVSGAVTYQDAEPTGELPGRLVRGPRTVAV